MLEAAAIEAEPYDRTLAIRAHLDAVWAAFYAGAIDEMVASGERASRLAQDADDDSASLVHIAYGMGLVLAGRGAEGSDEIRAGVTLLEGMPALEPESLGLAVAGPLFLREAGTGRGLLVRALDTARAQGVTGVLPNLLQLEARAVAAGEDWNRAHALYEEAIALAREIGQQPELAVALAGLAWLEAREGREAECRAHAGEALALTTAHGITFFAAWAVAALADLALAMGAVDEAISRLLELERHWDAAGRPRRRHGRAADARGDVRAGRPARGGRGHVRRLRPARRGPRTALGAGPPGTVPGASRSRTMRSTSRSPRPWPCRS